MFFEINARLALLRIDETSLTARMERGRGTRGLRSLTGSCKSRRPATPEDRRLATKKESLAT